MGDSQKQDFVFIGSVFTEIAEMLYYETEIKLCDKVQSEREPTSKHCRKTLLLENKHFHASWQQ